jgi:recombination protein RecA
LSKAEEKALAIEKKYGHQAGATGRFTRPGGVIPTGILALDYALGTGGWPYGTMVEVFGPPDIGKSSIMGLNAMKSVQKQGKLPAIVALEPGFDPRWAEKNGVDIDNLVIGWPDNGEQAFNLLYDFVIDDDIDFVLFDSIGALLRPSEAEAKGKPSQGGQSALITWGIKRVQMPVWKRNKSIMLLNQVRDDMNSHISGLLDSPGGHALKHACDIRIQLRPGKDRFTVKEDGVDVMAGRQIVAVVRRTKKDEGTNKRAVFDYFSMETDEYPFGVDVVQDVINTGKRTGVIGGGGAWLYHKSFPDGKLQGKAALAEFLAQKPEAVDKIRKEIVDKLRP